MRHVFIITIAFILLIPTSAFAQSSEHWSDELYTWYDYRLIEESQLNNALIYLQDREIIEIVIHSTEPADFIASVLDQRAGTSVPTASTLSADDYEDTKDCFDTLGVDGLTVEEKSVCSRIDREYVFNGNEGAWESYNDDSTYVGSSSVYDSGITPQSSKSQIQNEFVGCTGEFPYLWDDGSCWNLPQNYETQYQLECPDGYPYVWSDGNCYSVQECSADYSYRWNDGQCYNVQECKGEFPFRWSDGNCYSVLECPADYSYRWNDGQCYNVQECTGQFPYRHIDGICYNVPPPLACVDHRSYDTGYGYCCYNDEYTTGDGFCRQ